MQVFFFLKLILRVSKENALAPSRVHSLSRLPYVIPVFLKSTFFLFYSLKTAAAESVITSTPTARIEDETASSPRPLMIRTEPQVSFYPLRIISAGCEEYQENIKVFALTLTKHNLGHVIGILQSITQH